MEVKQLKMGEKSHYEISDFL